ncbi:Erd2 protein [Saccharomycopsis crataegensis]|uniref:Erd2 protein n=1 Tax=Saccharomycopsis crataegensis TaxID=43959 RepID=A0AAV5QK07_9ASCO|nr:Erd2 protein [Saccharomycopsis crataegensis]
MNIFRFLSDLSHLLSIFILLHRIQTSRSIAGISFKTQVLYAVVFATRYLDVFYSYVSLYNTLMKIFFMGSSLFIVYIMVYKFNVLNNQQPRNDDFKVEYLVGGAAVMSLLFTYSYHPTEVLWSFSLWLESVAIFPQLFMLQKTGEAESLTAHYIFTLGFYRALCIPNWIVRYHFEGKIDKIALAAGIVQTLVYSDFFYIYYQKVIKALKVELPV